MVSWIESSPSSVLSKLLFSFIEFNFIIQIDSPIERGQKNSPLKEIKE